MRHKWKKIKNENVKYKKKMHYIRQCNICVKCGLKKGHLGTYSYMWNGPLVYFKNGEVLSENILPFKCITKELNDMLFKKEDFMI